MRLRFLTPSPVIFSYQTLRSLFATFPEDVKVNVMVGNANADYVVGKRIVAAVGAQNAQRIHAWPTSVLTANFLATHLQPSRRGGWNTVRSLRSYRGHKGLLLMEDDIAWTREAMIPFNRDAAAESLTAFSLYNFHCYGIGPFTSEKTRASLANAEVATSPLILAVVDNSQFEFHAMQAVLYAPDIPGPPGRYTQRRMHLEHHDNVVGMFFRDHQTLIGYTFPSLVQHLGIRSAYGSAAFHQSECFRESL